MNIEDLKQEYYNTFSLFDKFKETHHKRSELLGEIVKITFKDKGFKGVQEVMHEMFWESQRLLSDLQKIYR